MVKANKLRNALRKARYAVLSRIYGRESEKARPSQQSIQDYWRDPPGKNNQPGAYIDLTEKSEALVRLAEELSVPKGPVLEIGSNVGRSLQSFLDHGWTDLSSIEINPQAVARMAELFPAAAAIAKVHNMSVEDAIVSLPDRHFDLVFSKAVLLHIHPDSEWVFEHMVRVTKGTLLVVENEDQQSYKLFPRKYRPIFEGLGMVQVDERILPEVGETYIARSFRHPDAV